MKQISITENEAEQRLDRFLRKYLKEFSLGDIYKLFRKNKVKVNNKRIKENYMLQKDDTVQLYIEDTALPNEEKADHANRINKQSHKPLTIIYEDEHILLCDKPAGLLTHPDKPTDADTLIGRVLHYLEEKGTKPESLTFRPSVCNRLDRNTGGVVIIAKDYQTLKAVNALIRERKIQKLYLCLVKGKVNRDGEIKNFLVKDQDLNKVIILNEHNEDAKAVHTIYKVLRTSEHYSLLEVELITGRSHQIRAHFASIGHPLAGDVKYGDKKANSFFNSEFGLDHQFLYAYKLRFEEPTDILSYLQNKAFTCPLPEKLQRIIDQLLLNYTSTGLGES